MTGPERHAVWGDESVPCRSSALAEQRARDRRVLLNIDTGRYYTLEGAADPIWELCDGRRTVRTIARAVSERYGADESTVRRDVIELLDELLAGGLVYAA